MAQDARKFQYNSDYPMPLVTYRAQFTLAPGTTNPTLFKFEHGLPYAPLLVGKASWNSDFSACGDITNGNSGVADSIIMQSDNKYVYFVLFPSSDMRANYVRIMGFVPPDYTGDITTISNDTLFRFNSDYDYVGCIQGALDSGDSPIVSHNLGYIPQARVWYYGTATVGSIEVSGYGIIEPELFTYKNSGVTVRESLTTSTELYTLQRSDEETLDSKVYYHIYTLEG